MDYYRILGVDCTATTREVQRAYRRLVKQWHPDRNPDRREEAAQRLREFTEAYDVLRDPEQRREYDEATGVYDRPAPPQEPVYEDVPETGYDFHDDVHHRQRVRRKMKEDSEAFRGLMLLLGLGCGWPIYIPLAALLVYLLSLLYQRFF